MTNEGKILAGLGGLCLIVTLFIPWAGGFTGIETFTVFAAIHLPFIAGSLLLALRGVVKPLVRVSSAEVDRLLLVLAALGQLGATIAGSSSQFGFGWGPGFWLTWILCLAALVVVFAGGAIPFLAGAGTGAGVGAGAAGLPGGVATPGPAVYAGAPDPYGAPAPDPYQSPAPTPGDYAPVGDYVPAPAGDYAPALGGDYAPVGSYAPAPVAPTPDPAPVVEAAATWLAVPAGTVSVVGQPVPSGEWLAVVSRSANSVLVRTEAGASYEVPAQTSFIYP